ncbi:hypothetical protein C5167_003815 [Papaver somniferum]|uniref:Glabrous enhancer-binding protein-like DBD domain-containing protein n=1 Tax=Papaver somniferum TaxID=3469 RepID=A0A4Y7L1N6_PAPSO|nr:STOREKEEPER protein-like [Papaver somniferum]RZC79463.1 hypothetical protein C5167_003815 [Papaver somniferum]
MTLKNHFPLPENPPSVSSSSASEDEREVEEEVVNDKEEESDDIEEEEEEEEEDGDDDEETEKSRFCVVPNSKPKSKDAVEEEEENSDDDSESDEQIPIEKEEAVKKPEHTSIPVKRPVAKRQVEAEKSSKRRKKNNDSNAGEESEKKTARVWTEEGEIVLLKGMIDYMKQGKNPNSDSNGFYEFIKGSINVDVTKEQLSSKIRHAKGRYRQNEAKEKSGEVLTFTKSHFEKCYELSKSIWGAENKPENDGKEKKGKETIEVDGATNGKSKKKKASTDASVSEKREEGVKVGDVDGKLKATVEKEDVEVCGLIELAQHMAPPGLKSFLNKRAFQLVEPSKRKAFEKRWKDVQVAEGELFLRRIDLVREFSSKALEALKSQTS